MKAVRGVEPSFLVVDEVEKPARATSDRQDLKMTLLIRGIIPRPQELRSYVELHQRFRIQPEPNVLEHRLGVCPLWLIIEFLFPNRGGVLKVV